MTPAFTPAWAALAVAAALTAPALAQVTPRLGVTAGSNDNVTLAPPASASVLGQAPRASRYVTWKPELAIALPGARAAEGAEGAEGADAAGADRYDITLRGELTRYAAASNDDSDNLELTVDGLNLLDPRTALAWRLAAQDWHDAVGATDLSLQATSPDHFRAEAAGGVLRHDSDDTVVRTEAELSFSHKRYRNHRETTRLGDVDSAGLAGRYLRTANLAGAAGSAGDPATTATLRWLAELRIVAARYPATPAGLTALDNTDTRLLAGGQWDPPDPADPDSAPYSGSLKLGLQRRNFAGNRPRYTGATWEGALHLRPRPGTLLDIATSRAAADAPGDGSDAVVMRQESLSWTERWRADLHSTLSFDAGDYHYLDHAGGADASRHDRITAVGLGLRFHLRRELQIGLDLGLARRRSNQPAFGYTRRITGVVLQVAL